MLSLWRIQSVPGKSSQDRADDIASLYDDLTDEEWQTIVGRFTWEAKDENQDLQEQSHTLRDRLPAKGLLG